MNYYFLVFLLSLSFNSFASETKEFQAEGIKKIEITNPKGEIIISSNKNSKKIIVSIEKVQFDKECKFNLSSKLDTMMAKVEHENSFFDKANCVAILKVEVPAKSFDYDVTSGSGTIKMNDVDGKIDFKTATGVVEISGESLKNIEGKTATGNMRLTFNRCPTRADINLASATGDAEINLPIQCKIRVSHKSATGSLFNELGESEEYQVMISSKSAGGNLKIKKIIK